MKRSAAITAAATASLAAVAVTTGIALNLGILGHGTTDAAGVALVAEKSRSTAAALSSTAATRPRATTAVPQTEYLTIYEDIPAPAAAEVPAIPLAAPEPAAPSPGESTAEGSGNDGVPESEGRA